MIIIIIIIILILIIVLLIIKKIIININFTQLYPHSLSNTSGITNSPAIINDSSRLSLPSLLNSDNGI